MKRKSSNVWIDGLPDTLLVGKYTINIIAMPPKWQSLPAGERILGEYLDGAHEIRLRRHMSSKERAIDVTIHEIMHAIFVTYGLRDGDDEERTIDVMARGWCQVVIDNPKLVSWLQELTQTPNESQ